MTVPDARRPTEVALLRAEVALLRDRVQHLREALRVVALLARHACAAQQTEPSFCAALLRTVELAELIEQPHEGTP